MADIEVQTHGPFKVGNMDMAGVERVVYRQANSIEVVWERFSCDMHWDRYPPTPLPMTSSA